MTLDRGRTQPRDDGFVGADEARPITVDDVCVIVGPGRGECWGCPVRTCVLWKDPTNPLSEATQATALGAARQLASRSKVIAPWTRLAQEDVVAVAEALAMEVITPAVATELVVQMAAEAIMQDVVRDAVVKKQHQYTDKWLKGLRGRLPTPDDDADMDALMDKAAADAAAEAYGCDPKAVLKQLLYFRGRKIVRRDRD